MSSSVRQGTSPEMRYDAAVVGGGLAGLAASIQLAKAGFHVICFEPVEEFGHIVGESLDWSAPALFRQIGLEMEDLIQSKASTYKRHVTLKLTGGGQTEYVPSPWLAEPPLDIELRTLHVDRSRLHEKLLAIAEQLGVSLIHDRVSGVERQGRTIHALRTAAGVRVAANWFIDASGSASSFLGRELHLPSIEYGRRKVAMWGQFRQPDSPEGTTLYADAPEGQYLEWIWEIPINPETVSIGYVSTGESIKKKRAQGLTVEEIYSERLSKLDRFQLLLEEQGVQSLKVTSFSCRTFRQVCGPNWVIIGEAASVPDPITSNGVTAALRQAIEASRLICRFRERGRISGWSQAAYSVRVLNMAKFFNSLIEKLAYSWPIRDRIGLLKAGDVYTIPAWSINQIYTLFAPDGLLSSALFSLFLSSFRLAASFVYNLCKLLGRATRVPVSAFAN